MLAAFAVSVFVEEPAMKWLIAAAWLLGMAGQVVAQPSGTPTVRPYLWSAERPRSEIGEINVFRRFSSERTAAMREFYSRVLGLPVLPDTALGGGQMIRYPVGASEVKLFPVAPSPANTARVSEAVGVRLLTFFYADDAALTTRFMEHGLAAPRAFYGDLMGLAEAPPLRDELIGATKHSFKHGSTTINLWSFGPGLPKDSQTGGMQYIVWNVAAIDAVVRERGAKIDRPLSAPGQMRTLWLADPDGVSNYFAELAGNDNSPPAAR
jgi:hypothetical protein